MARLLQLQTRVRETVAAMAELEKALSRQPDSDSLALIGKSLRSQYEQFRADFLAEAGRSEMDICTYRLFATDTQRYTVDGITTPLHDFQRLFTIVYDALKGRPKEKAIIGTDIVKETQFGWAYMFPGSVGMVLTVPRSRDLFGSSPYFDQTIETIFAMAKSRTAHEVLTFAKQVGVSAIRQMYTWAEDHATWGLGADIEWKGQKPNGAHLFIQLPEILNLRNTISLSSEIEEKEVEIFGELIGADINRKSFHIQTDGTPKDIRGHFSDAITAQHKAQLPAFYLAKLRRTVRVIYSTDQEDEQYFLLSLEPRQ
jgi:hypothetical protein